MTKAMEGFCNRHPDAKIDKVFDPVTKLTSYIFTDDRRGFFDKKSVTHKTMSENGAEKVEATYTKGIERRFYA